MTSAPDRHRPLQPRRAEGPLELRVRGATQEQLAFGLARAREVLRHRGVAPGHAFVCQSAVTAHALYPALPEPDQAVRDAAQACEEAFTAAVLSAGGSLGGDDALAFEQSPDDACLWDTLPTLRAYRHMNGATEPADAQATAS